MSMTLVVRSEVLNLARTHLAYARNPAVRERIERLPIIRPGKFLLSCIRQKAVKNLQRKVESRSIALYCFAALDNRRVPSC